MTKDEIKDKIIEIYEKLLKIDGDIIIVNSSLSYLKSQLSEAGEENKSSHELQNERMRIWFQKRTGLIDAMLCTHMKKIDEMLSIDPVE